MHSKVTRTLARSAALVFALGALCYFVVTAQQGANPEPAPREAPAEPAGVAQPANETVSAPKAGPSPTQNAVPVRKPPRTFLSSSKSMVIATEEMNRILGKSDLKVDESRKWTIRMDRVMRKPEPKRKQEPKQKLEKGDGSRE